MLTAHDIAVNLGKRAVLRGVNLEARPGQVTSVIGPNGSGKTTLLRALCGELRFSGAARFGDLDIARAKPFELASRRGVLAQQASLAFPFTVHEVVRLGLSMGVSGLSDHAGTRVEEALARVDLEGFGARYYQELSGGEQQRVQLARVLCQVWEPVTEKGPHYLFLDEPVSSLDIKHQLQIMHIAEDYAARGGGVLAVMHDLNLTAAYSDHVCLLSDGRVHASGSAVDVLTSENLEAVYGCAMRVGPGPDGRRLLILPQYTDDTPSRLTH